ncbi:MAG: 5'-deoxynucleotidase [Lachnospiraceae bacterium]|nr:5'-deoxynucleotidase [Lachnospiraceae bacterium]MDD7023716.1 5'-deoxynucleotidase [Oscillospiraceae bacterium]MDY5540170.1 5'-deoxynucleotidase [Lachnospiraceae bacterium]MDY5649210.1 5'-deoxynucleotidase [Lachnospiraceae bacterium]
MNSSFFAMMSRMKHIERWALMRNTRQENLSEHSLQVGMIAHALAVISNTRCHRQLDPSKAALMGMYHDASEIITGDMPTPVKYRNPEIQGAFKALEDAANQRLLCMLPKDMQPYYQSLFCPEEADAYLWKLVKAADKLSAYIKCIEEATTGNSEFLSAQQATRTILNAMDLPEVTIFMEEFLSSFGKTLDELTLSKEEQAVASEDLS